MYQSALKQTRFLYENVFGYCTQGHCTQIYVLRAPRRFRTGFRYGGATSFRRPYGGQKEIISIVQPMQNRSGIFDGGNKDSHCIIRKSCREQ